MYTLTLNSFLSCSRLSLAVSLSSFPSEVTQQQAFSCRALARGSTRSNANSTSLVLGSDATSQSTILYTCIFSSYATQEGCFWANFSSRIPWISNILVYNVSYVYVHPCPTSHSKPLFRGKPRIHEKPEEVYLFMGDLVQQRFNAHAQTPRGRPLNVTGKGRHQCIWKSESHQCSMLEDNKICVVEHTIGWLLTSYLFISSWSHSSGYAINDCTILQFIVRDT